MLQKKLDQAYVNIRQVSASRISVSYMFLHIEDQHVGENNKLFPSNIMVKQQINQDPILV